MCGYPQLTTNLPSISVDFSWAFHINGVRQYEDLASVFFDLASCFWDTDSCCCVHQCLVIFIVVFCGMNMSCFAHVFTIWWTLGLFPQFGYYEWCSCIIWILLKFTGEFCLLIGCLPDFCELLFSPWLLMSILWGGAWKWYKIPCSWLNFKFNYFCYHELEFMF